MKFISYLWVFLISSEIPLFFNEERKDEEMLSLLFCVMLMNVEVVVPAGFFGSLLFLVADGFAAERTKAAGAVDGGFLEDLVSLRFEVGIGS